MSLRRFLDPALSLLAVVPLIVSACAPSATATSAPPSASIAEPVKGGTLTDSIFSDAATMQPMLAVDTGSSQFIGLQYNAPLIRYDPDTLKLDTKYGTAESYSIAADGLAVTFKLKNNIFWSDGKPITAGDYKFTFDKQIFDPQVEYPARANFKQFESVSAPDDKTVVFKLKEAFCPALNQLTFQPVPKHVFDGLNINDNPFNTKPTVGSGPWLLKEWVRDQYAIFEANDTFYLGRPNIDRYIIKIVKDQTIQYASLKSGDVDLATVRAEDWDDVKANKSLQAIGYYPAAGNWTFIGFNLRNEILKDLRVRQALAMAMDRQTMATGIRQGHAKPLDTIYVSENWAASTDVAVMPFDVAKAKALLDDAGWKAPAAGGTRIKDGKPLKLRIFYNSGNKEREQIATVAQQYAKAIGVELEVIQEEFNAYLNRITKSRDFELNVLGWASTIEPHTAVAIWASDGGQNTTGLAIPKVDTLFTQAATVASCSLEDRKASYSQIQKLVTAEVPYIFLWENEILTGVNERFVTNPLTKLGVSYRLWEWYSKTGK